MLVRDWMTKNVITLGLKTTVVDAAEIMRTKKVRQFPVIDEQGRLTGIVSDRDIRDAMPSKYLPGDAATGGSLDSLRAADIMTPEPMTVSPTTPVDLVASILMRHKFGGLPVVDEAGRLVGIITVADVFRFLCTASGVQRGGPQIALRLEAKAGPLAAMLEFLRGEGVRFASVFTSHDHADPGFRNAYVRIADLGEHSMDSLIATMKSRYTLLFFVEDGRTTLLEG
ncbi:MAG: CBS domain-containing protein [Humidesulfovibrio sp.]|uniref:CBS domain-containing protein n=1 Tax=Humidesulfovibrio sp. TaxID=2910988 RepID=UPI002737378A|nr:CBS domain-containing protein [Humidesulfovibrio sp.]MDP2847151.1 CBS domain-containing protein [Humidesulfovibrio sp.]